MLLLQKLNRVDFWYGLGRFGFPTQELFHIIKQEKTWRWLTESLADKTEERNERKRTKCTHDQAVRKSQVSSGNFIKEQI